MSSVDDLEGPGREPPGGQVQAQLAEALILLLIEKGVLTRNDALSIVQTVADVQRGQAVEAREPDAQNRAALHMLQRLYRSFEALAVSRTAAPADGENIHLLRPPSHDDRTEFPRDD